MIPRSRRRLFGLYALTAGGGRRARRPPLVPAGARHHPVQGAGLGQPDQADRGAGGARRDHRRHRDAVRAERDRDGRLGQHDGPFAADQRRRRGRAQEAGAAAAPVGQGAQREGQALHPGVPQPCWTGSPYQPVPVAERVSDATALQIMEQPKVFIGVTASLQPVTDYPMPSGANPSQVLGYLQPITQSEMAADHLPETGFAGDDLVGQAGLEAQYNTELTGKPGSQIVSVNAAGDVLNTVGGTPAQTGDTLVTSINAKVQAVAQQALNSAIDTLQGVGEQREPGRGGGGDDRRPDRGDGELPGLQPVGLDQRDLPEGVQLPVRQLLGRSGDELRRPRASTRRDRRSRSPRPPPRSPTGSRSTGSTTARPRSPSAAARSPTTVSRTSARSRSARR